VKLDEELIEKFVAHASGWSGFARDAIHRDAIRRAVRDCLSQPMTKSELLERAAANDATIVHVFRQAICVGETYFFRSPDHFAFLMDRVLAPMFASGATSVRAWSAASSTGEEAYSIAACLLASALPRAHLEVVGTDLSPESVRRARLGEYGAWSVRETAPIRLPLFQSIGDGRIRVNDDVRAITTFATHDLLHPAPPDFGAFDVIFCRNVLVYFDPASIAIAVAHLAERLLPGGVILFGVLEVSDTPPGLVPIGDPGLTAFQRPLHGRPKTLTRRPNGPPPVAAPRRRLSLKPEQRRALTAQRRSSAPPAAKPLTTETKARHLDALHLIETHRRRDALALFAQIQRRVPAYVAGLLDHALLCQRAGHRKLAADLMQEILRLTAQLPVEMVLPGIEELPVAYYRTAAESFLESMRRPR
jgi:chemotaxis protein methyltransferase CheR